ncbi:MAG: hypothetical protein ACK56I_07530, partial [bacterium]
GEVRMDLLLGNAVIAHVALQPNPGIMDRYRLGHAVDDLARPAQVGEGRRLAAPRKRLEQVPGGDEAAHGLVLVDLVEEAPMKRENQLVLELGEGDPIAADDADGPALGDAMDFEGGPLGRAILADGVA